MPRSRRDSRKTRPARVKPRRRRPIAASVLPTEKLKLWLSSRSLSLKIAALALVLLGIVLLLFPTLYTFSHGAFGHPPAPVSEEEASGSAALAAGSGTQPFRIDKKFLRAPPTTHIPLRIIIPSLSIDLPVVEAKIVNGFWEVSETTASHGIGSAYPEQNGNIVIFAHARKGLFLPLRDIKRDATVYILTGDSWHRFRVMSTKLVKPDDTTVITPTDEETLTLFTCDGFLDDKRLIVTATPYRP